VNESNTDDWYILISISGVHPFFNYIPINYLDNTNQEAVHKYQSWVATWHVTQVMILLLCFPKGVFPNKGLHGDANLLWRPFYNQLSIIAKGRAIES